MTLSKIQNIKKITVTFLVSSFVMVFMAWFSVFMIIICMFLFILIGLSSKSFLKFGSMLIIEVVMVLIFLFVIGIMEIIVECLMFSTFFFVVDILKTSAFVSLVLENFASYFSSFLSMCWNSFCKKEKIQFFLNGTLI